MTWVMHGQSDFFDNTLASLQKRTDLEPNNPEAWLRLAEFYSEKVRTDAKLPSALAKQHVMSGRKSVGWALKLDADYRDALIVNSVLLVQRSRWSRKVGNDLLLLWNDTYRQVQEAVLKPELVEVQVVLMDRCLSRIRQSPDAETENVRADIDYLRTLLALPDEEMAAKFKARLKVMLDAFGTPEAANQTLRINLGLPVPH